MPKIRIRTFLHFASTLLVSSCGFFECDPYECQKAQEGRDLYEPTIAAIEEYLAQQGSYPDGLGNLHPTFIESITISAGIDGPKQPEYVRRNGSYEFSFRYFGPGTNVCTYSPGKSWICSRTL